MIIVDTSCLIALEKINLLSLLCKLFERIIVPEGVIREYGKLDLECIEIRKVKDPFVNFLRKTLNLGKGEAEAITLALRNKGILIIDDLKARECAEDLNIKFTGTIGLLLKAEEKKFITSAYKKIMELKKKGFYISDSLIKQIKKTKDNT